jgi:soluble epoxide hydrolase/lipid-phosphate phosphatase
LLPSFPSQLAFPVSNITTSKAFVYKYIHVKPAKNEGRYLLFLHGFPSSSYDWRHQIQYFSRKGYGVWVPDLLGFGESVKPLDVQAYKGRDMANDVIEILEL